MKKFYLIEVTTVKTVIEGTEKEENGSLTIPVYEETEKDAIGQGITSLLQEMYMELREGDSISEVIIDGNNLILKGTDRGRELVSINTFKVSESDFIHFK